MRPRKDPKPKSPRRRKKRAAAAAGGARTRQSRHTGERMARVGHWERDFDRDYAFWSPEVYRILGLKPGKFRPNWRSFLRLVHPEDVEGFRNDVRRAMESPQPYGMEYRIVRPDGAVRYIHSIAEAREDPSGKATGLHGTLQDITNRRQTEQDLRESEEQYRDFVENTDDLVTRVDERGRFLYVNQAAKAFFGLAPLDCFGHSAFEFVHPDDRHRTRDALRNWLKQRALHAGIENRQLHRDGSVRDVLWSIHLHYDRRGRASVINSLGRDITQRKRAEQQLLQSQKMEALGQLAAGIAHDFRNQLTIMDGFARMLLRRGLVKTDGRDYMEEIVKAAERSTELTGRLLTFGRKEVLHPKTVDLAEEAAALVATLPRVLGPQIRLNAPRCRRPCPVQLDPAQFQQALLNLVTNARDAMPRGGRLTIQIEPADLVVLEAASRGLAPGRYARLCVSDTGAGMDERTRQKAFEPFFSTKEIGKGTGLGLSMVYGFVKDSRGAVEIESSPGKGTTVRVFFPLVGQ